MDGHLYIHMEYILDNLLHMHVSSLMKKDKAYATDLGVEFKNQLLALDIHKWETTDYINWNSEVYGYCDNLKVLIDAITHVQMIVGKLRINTPENELHIDG